MTKTLTLQLIYCLCYCYLSGLITVYSFVPLGLLLLRPVEGQALWSCFGQNDLSYIKRVVSVPFLWRLPNPSAYRLNFPPPDQHLAFGEPYPIHQNSETASVPSAGFLKKKKKKKGCWLACFPQKKDCGKLNI